MYLKGTMSRGIIYGNHSDSLPIFHSYCDSDWAISERRKSVSGYVILCGGGLISWSSKQQGIVTLFTCEDEYIACTHCARQVIWLCSLFSELGFPQAKSTLLNCNNLGTVACTHDPHSHSRMKHINIRAHFIQDCVNNSIIDIHYIPGIENPSDLLTKRLARPIHDKWLLSLCLNVNQENVGL
jgi:hypothetical protein